MCGEIVLMLKRCMGHLYEHLQKGKECAKGTIIDFEKTVQASSNGENRKSLQLLFVDIDRWYLMVKMFQTSSYVDNSSSLNHTIQL